MSETVTEVPAKNPEATPDTPTPPAVKRFSDFEDGMLAGVRHLNQDEDLRREVAKRIS